MELTKLELESLIYSITQKHLVKGKYKTALKKSAKKLEKELSKVRNQEIYNLGVYAAKSGKPASACPRKFGCLTQITWYDGYCSINKTGKNPYRG